MQLELVPFQIKHVYGDDMNDFTVILNGYKRPHTLKHQFNAAANQTIRPKNIFYWQNTVSGVQYDVDTPTNCISSISNANFGVWSRFTYALNAKTDYICILDDDTIPGRRWLENCLDTFNKVPDVGLLGTIGVIFKDNDYIWDKRIGWDNPNENPEVVDIVGHSWVFRRDMLSVFWRELPPIDHDFISGEDIHFSYMLQKYTNYKTYVPPHPKDNRELWGSLKGWELGADAVATAANGGMPLMGKYLRKCCENGFKLINS